MKTKQKTVKLTLSAIFVALSAGLSMVTFFHMPLGGTVTLLSMLPVIMVALMLGYKWGLGAAFAYSLTQLALGIAVSGVLAWGLTYKALIGTIFLDYIIPFTALGLAGFACKKSVGAKIFATASVIVIRFLCHLLSGAIIFDIWCEWENVWFYSLCYNGAYMLPELVFTVVGAAILFAIPRIKRIMDSF